ncbi:MAG: hypothetical protein JNM17_02230 [Archangium sp.]|nr:hypothetical protein [Archangium sp.]
MALDALGREGGVILFAEALSPAKLEAAVRASRLAWSAWDRLSPALTCLRQRGSVSEELDTQHQALVRALGVPAWWAYANVAADPYVAITALDAKGKVRWVSRGAATRALGKLKRDAALGAIPFPVETRPVFDFAELGWREASEGSARKWKYLARAPAAPPPSRWAPTHTRELVIAFAGRSEAAERAVIEALTPQTWAIHRVAPTVTLIRIPGGVAQPGLESKVRKKYGFTTLACGVDLRAQRVTWDSGALDLKSGTGMAATGIAFDWQAVLEKAGSKWKLRATSPDVLVGA